MAQLFEKDQIGKREELADYVSLVDSHNTPVSSMARKGSKPGNSIMSWSVTALDSVTNTGTVDGTDVSSYDHNTRALCQNYVQIYRLATRVSPLSELSNVAGVKSELAFQISQKLVELKRKIELSICSEQDAQADDGSNPYMTKGLGVWISESGGSTLQVPRGFRTPAASIENDSTTTTSTITDSHIQNVLSSIFSETGTITNYACPVGRTLKRAFTDRLTGIRTAADGGSATDVATQVRTFNPQKGRAVEMRVDQFVGDFGTLDLLPSNWLPEQTDGFVLNPSDIELRYSSLPSVTTLPNSGAGEARMIEAIAALVVRSGGLNHGKFDLAS